MMEGTMKKRLLLSTLLSALFFGGSAHAASLTVGCGEIARYSPTEVNMFYYRVMETDGEAEAGRLWGAYHRLQSRCVSHPNAHATVSVSAQVASAVSDYR
jgi:hypothetical protein